MDPVTAGLNAFTAWATLQNTILTSLTPAQREQFLQPQITVLNTVAQGLIDFNKRLIDLVHPVSVAAGAPHA